LPAQPDMASTQMIAASLGSFAASEVRRSQTAAMLRVAPSVAGKMLRMIRRLKSSRRASSYTFDEYRSTSRADAARASRRSAVHTEPV
jgi:hypothetical protein